MNFSLKSLHSIKTKLLLMFFIPLVLFMVAAVYLLGALSSTVDRLSERLETASDINGYVLNADRDLYQALTGFMNATLGETDGDAQAKALASYEENLQQTKEQLAAA